MRKIIVVLVILIVVVWTILLALIFSLDSRSTPHGNAATSTVEAKTFSAIDKAITETVAAKTATP